MKSLYPKTPIKNERLGRGFSFFKYHSTPLSPWRGAWGEASLFLEHLLREIGTS